MLESLKKTIEDSEAFTARLKEVNERLQILVDIEKQKLEESKKVLADLERQINDLIFDAKRKQTQLPKIERVVAFPKTNGYPPDFKFDFKCIWDSLPDADKMKPMGLSCSCPKCSPHSVEISDGSESMRRLSERFREAFSNRRDGVVHLKLNE